MKFPLDHDLHIHSQLSLCSDDPQQTPERILRYGVEKGLKHICLTDHFWDEKVPLCEDFDFYARQDYAHIAQALPLPQAEGITFHFGVETDMDRLLQVGVSRERLEEFEFIIVPTSHLHMGGFTFRVEDGATVAGRARLWVERLEALLAMDLPFAKMGLAHPTDALIYPAQWDYHLQVLDAIPEGEYARLFALAAKRGLGIELNMPIFKYAEEELPRVLRPFAIAREQGCRFYLGSDAHHPADLEGAMARFERMTQLMGLTHEDRFSPFE